MNKPLVVITGAGSGIGRACAIKFQENGYQVACLDIDLQEAKNTLKLINSDGRAYQVDVSDYKIVEKISQNLISNLCSPCALINCAGISPNPMPTHLYDIEEWKRVIDINLNGSFYMMKYLIPALLENSNSSIVNISSVLGVVANATTSGYAASKHAIVGLTKATALDYAQQGLRVNCVGPGVIETNMTKEILADPKTKEMLSSQTPIGRVAKPREVANLIYYLSSEDAEFITGSFFPIDGGYTTA
ncbi:MAG: SDR family NAD(P)-dependent oxidoreductase [SAR86 cluster bacterium]|jgi:NAD(P)-dependent dehydrogenase (short-subunit alcohol dehydrogenase family)|nr:SDR family NAD(P)-dependent oxidoreductase [SAR86 cluster bacterium]